MLPLNAKAAASRRCRLSLLLVMPNKEGAEDVICIVSNLCIPFNAGCCRRGCLMEVVVVVLEVDQEIHEHNLQY